MKIVLLAAALLGTAVAAPAAHAEVEPATVFAEVETPSLANNTAGGFAYAGYAVAWLHPSDPGRSTFVATIRNGIAVYDLAGNELQQIAGPPSPGPGIPAARYNALDVQYGFKLGGKRVDLAVVADRGFDKLRIFSIDPETRLLTDVADPANPTVFVPPSQVPRQQTAIGVALYRDQAADRLYAFVSQRRTAVIKQIELLDNGAGGVTWAPVRSIPLPTVFETPNGPWTAGDPQVEGMVVDQQRGVLYANSESVGLWRMSARPDAGDRPVLVEKVAGFGGPGSGLGGELMDGDVLGATIYYGPGESGYLIISSEEESACYVFDRAGDNAFLGNAFVLGDGPSIDGTTSSHGIHVTTTGLGPRFPKGAFIAQDSYNTPEIDNPNASTNYKIIGWDRIADAFEPPLLVDTTSYDPRNPAGYVCAGRRATAWPVTGHTGPILGTDGDDVIVGGPGDDVILAGAGNDLVCGGGGHDVIDGGAGRDVCQGDVTKNCEVTVHAR